MDVETSTTRQESAVRAGMKRFRLTRFRLFVLAALAACATFAGAMVWRTLSLRELPDVGEPFDVTLASRPVFVADDDNAFVSYAEAGTKRSRLPAAIGRVDLVKLTWGQAETGVREYLEANRPALEIWRAGTDRPDALYHQPGKLAFDTTLDLVDDLRELAWLAGLEGSRLEEQGDMSAAWSWYRAMLRSSRHVGKRGVLLERMTGAMIHEKAARRIIRWAGDSRVDAALLRRALADALAADALTPPLSENMKLEYVMCMRDLNELRVMIDEIPLPGGRFGVLEQAVTSKALKGEVKRARLHVTNDVERSRRILQLLYANWLAQVDRPAALRAPIASPLPLVIYESDPSAPLSARAIAPDKLHAAIGKSLFAQEYLRPKDWPASRGGPPWTGSAWVGNWVLAREPRRRALLIVKLAAELYRRERGSPPANAGALLPGYLKELPEGIAPDDRIPEAID